MSQKQFLKIINKEIQNLNETIDRKILQGVEYRREARRHRTLLAQIRRVQRRRMFGRRFGFLGVF